MADKAKQEEPKQSLPTGHAQAGYTSPDLSTHEGTGTIPDAEKEWHEARNQAQQDEVETVAEGEDKVVKEEQAAAEKAAAEASSETEAAVAAAPAAKTGTTASKS